MVNYNGYYSLSYFLQRNKPVIKITTYMTDYRYILSAQRANPEVTLPK